MIVGIDLRLDAVHRGVGPRDRARAHPLRPPDRPRLLDVPRLALEHAQRHPGHPDVAARDDRHHLFPRLHLQHLHPARPGPGRGHRRRRRDHGHGEHLPPRGGRQGPRRRRPRGDARDRLRRPGRDAGRRRHLHPRRLHQGHHRPVLPPVRRHPLPGRAPLLRRGDHPGPGPLLAVPEDDAGGPEPRRAASSTDGFRWLERVYARVLRREPQDARA